MCKPLELTPGTPVILGATFCHFHGNGFIFPGTVMAHPGVDPGVAAMLCTCSMSLDMYTKCMQTARGRQLVHEQFLRFRYLLLYVASDVLMQSCCSQGPNGCIVVLATGPPRCRDVRGSW
jgi:hypothetical protein